MKANIYQKVRTMAKAALPVAVAALAPLLNACSPDSFDGADENGIPTMEGIDFNMTVDQEVNQVLLSVPQKQGMYPVWTINGATYSTLQEVGWSNTERGTYSVELRMANRNGFSQGSITKYFTFNETKINYTAMFNRIKDKEWRIDNAEPAHMACGPNGGDGTGWWSAAPDDKKGFGVYDDRITFTVESNKGGTYTYNPGADGKTYVNYGTTIWGSQPEPDYDVATEAQTSSWYFQRGTWTDAEGQVIDVDYLVLADNTLFPYISADAQYQHPRFRIESLTASKMVLIYEGDGISWRYILTSKAAEKVFEGFDANSDFNLWKGITPTMSFHFQPGWGDVRTPEMEATFESGDNDYSVTVPDACADRWQAQMHFHTNLTTSAANHYDFSVILNADHDIDGVTLKLTQEDDAAAMIDVADISLKAGEDFIFWRSDLEGVDLNTVKLVFDFGYASGPTTVNVRNIVLKDHANDDGTVLPDQGGQGGEGGGEQQGGTMDWDYDSAANLWKAVDDGSMFDAFGYYFADNGWGPIAYNEATHSGDAYEIDLPANLGGSQWQGQFHIDTKLTASASKKYNFYLVMEADNDLPQVTFKLTDSGDTNFFFEERVDVPAGGFVYKKEGVSLKEGKDATAVRMFFDFGGSPAGTHVKISKIYFEEVVSMDYADADNLWKAVDDGSMFDAFGYYFADNGWAGIPYTEATHSGDAYEIDLPEGLGGSQWQGQFHIDTKLTASASKQYAFQLVMEADNDLPQVTFKLTDSGDTNYFFEERIDVPGGEPFTLTRKGITLKEGKDATAIRMFFDFGGSPAGTHVKISKIIFKEI